jgi:hypothetical protein
MFSSVKAESILSYGEVKLIACIKDWLREVSPPSPQGMGDDCAIIDTSQINQQLLTTDSISYGCHFDHTVSAKQAGAKLINRTLATSPPWEDTRARLYSIYSAARTCGLTGCRTSLKAFAKPVKFIISLWSEATLAHYQLANLPPP